MRNARTVIAGVLCALMICCMLGNAYTVKGKEMLLAPENKETKDQNTENSKIEDNNTENEEELNKGAKKEDTSMHLPERYCLNRMRIRNVHLQVLRKL